MDNELARHGIEELIEKATEFLAKVVNPPLEELGGLLADHVKFWRFKNQVNLITKAEAFLDERGVAPQPIPLKTLVPLLEESSWEEESSMQDRWASLLASAADPNFASTLLPSYVDILKQLSPLEATLLDSLYDEYQASSPEQRESLQFGRNAICQRLKIDADDFDLMANNLMRLSLLEPPASHGGVFVGEYPIVLRTFQLVQLTVLGRDFVRNARYGRGGT